MTNDRLNFGSGATMRCPSLFILSVAVVLLGGFSHVKAAFSTSPYLLPKNSPSLVVRSVFSTSPVGLSEKSSRFRIPFVKRFRKTKHAEKVASAKPVLAVGKQASTIPYSVKMRNQRPGRLQEDAVVGESPSRWSALKNVVYNSADAVVAVPRKMGVGKSKQKSELPRPYMGYGSVHASNISKSAPKVEINNDATTSKTDTPGAKLMKQYDSRVLQQQQPVVTSEGKEGGDDDDGDKSIEKVLRTLKDGTYDVVDKISGKSANPTLSPMSPEGVSPGFKPVAKVSNNEESDSELRRLLPDLESRNPLKKLKAKAAVRRIEKRRKEREARASREEAINKIKEVTYNVVDFAGATAQTISKTSEKIAETASVAKETTKSAVKVIQHIPSKLDDALDEVKATPKKVEAKVNEIADVVEDTKKVALNVVEDVKAIPTNVQNTVEATKKTVDDIGSMIDEFSTSLKVMAGMEIPKPKPPRLPPPPPPMPLTPKEKALELAGQAGVVAGQVAGTVAKEAAKGTGKAVLFAGKGVANGVFNIFKSSMKSVMVAFTEAIMGNKKAEENLIPGRQISQRTASLSRSREPIKKPDDESTVLRAKTVTTLSEVDIELDREVTDALALAEEALSASKDMTAKNELPSNVKTIPLPDVPVVKTIQLDDALRNAQIAAKEATKAAAEVEKISLKTKRKDFFLTDFNRDKKP